MNRSFPTYRTLSFKNSQAETFVWIPGWGGNSWTLLPLVEQIGLGRHILMDPLSRKDLETAGRQARDLSIELMADSILEALEKEKSPWHLIGISMGGLVAQVVADRSPSQTASLHLCCTHAGGANETEAAANSAMQSWWGRCAPGEDPITKILKRCFSPKFRAEPGFEEYLTHLKRNPAPVSGSTLKLQWQAAVKYDGLPYLSRLRLPVYVYQGSQDEVVRKGVGDRLVEALGASAKLEVFPGGHLFFLESPLEFSEILVKNALGNSNF